MGIGSAPVLAAKYVCCIFSVIFIRSWHLISCNAVVGHTICTLGCSGLAEE